LLLHGFKLLFGFDFSLFLGFFSNLSLRKSLLKLDLFAFLLDFCLNFLLLNLLSLLNFFQFSGLAFLLSLEFLLLHFFLNFHLEELLFMPLSSFFDGFLFRCKLDFGFLSQIHFLLKFLLGFFLCNLLLLLKIFSLFLCLELNFILLSSLSFSLGFRDLELLCLGFGSLFGIC